jgi:hypothetical protein
LVLKLTLSILRKKFKFKFYVTLIRVAITDIYHLKKLCYHHNNPLKFYCESCEEPVCHECQMMGPHNNKLHRISNVFESFRRKFTYINNLVQKSLVSKLDALTNQIGDIEFHIESVKNTRYDIEREIRSEYSQLIENLRGEEGKKLAVLQYDSSILQKEINKIQDIIHIVNDIAVCDSPDMIGFLLRYKQLNETVELTLVKPFKKSIDVNCEDFPRELDKRREKMEELEKLKRLLKAKDDIIWNLIQEKKDQEEKELRSYKEKTHNEIAEWAKLSDKYSMELKKYHLVCHFCGCFLSEECVNSLCGKNSAENGEKSKNTTKIVPAEIINTKRHFFGPPSQEYEMKMASGLNTTEKKIFSSNISSIPNAPVYNSGSLTNPNRAINQNYLPNKAPLLNTINFNTNNNFQPTTSLNTLNLDKTKVFNESSKNPFEKNILNETKLPSRSTSPSTNLRYSDENLKGRNIF